MGSKKGNAGRDTGVGRVGCDVRLISFGTATSSFAYLRGKLGASSFGGVHVLLRILFIRTVSCLRRERVRTRTARIAATRSVFALCERFTVTSLGRRPNATLSRIKRQGYRAKSENTRDLKTRRKNSII